MPEKKKVFISYSLKTCDPDCALRASTEDRSNVQLGQGGSLPAESALVKSSRRRSIRHAPAPETLGQWPHELYFGCWNRPRTAPRGRGLRRRSPRARTRNGWIWSHQLRVA